MSGRRSRFLLTLTAASGLTFLTGTTASGLTPVSKAAPHCEVQFSRIARLPGIVSMRRLPKIGPEDPLVTASFTHRHGAIETTCDESDTSDTRQEVLRLYLFYDLAASYPSSGFFDLVGFAGALATSKTADEVRRLAEQCYEASLQQRDVTVYKASDGINISCLYNVFTVYR